MKNLKDIILEKLKIDNNKLSASSTGFSEDCLYEFYDEDEYNFEKYGEILFDGHLFGLYRYILHHNSTGVPIKRLLIMTSPAVYGSIVVKDKNEELTMVQINICNELVKIFDVSNHQIYAETYKNYVEDMKDSSVDDWVATDEFIDWLYHVTNVSGLKFYSYDVNFYKE